MNTMLYVNYISLLEEKKKLESWYTWEKKFLKIHSGNGFAKLHKNFHYKSVLFSINLEFNYVNIDLKPLK